MWRSTVNRDFTPIADGEGLRDLPQDLIKDLSRDQRYLYEIVKSIRSGTLSDIAKKHKIGPVNHSRWLTLASRICRLYVSNVELDQNSMNNLRTLAHFVVTHYAPMWFNIKCEPLYKDGPLNVLRAVKLFKLLPPDVQSIVKPVIERNAYSAHSENILLAMLADTDKQIRKKGLEKISEIRWGRPFGNTKFRSFVAPQINFDAEDYYELISWESVWHEPIITAKMGEFQLKKIEN